MKMPRKSLAVLSSTAITALFSTVMATPALAADRDIYSLTNLSTPAFTAAQTANFANQKTISLNSQNYGYELSGNVYKFDDLTSVYNANGNDYAKTISVLPTSATPVGPVTPVTTGLAVSSVSAITKTGVTVDFPALTTAQATATVTVLNDQGVAVPVTAKLLDVGETTATFNFTTALTTDPVGNWTVNGVSYDANAQVAVNAVNAATDQVKLLAALNSSYFTGVNADKIVDYFTAMNGTTYTSVADIQKAIDTANTSITDSAAVKAVVTAETATPVNEVTLLTALQDSHFARVNADWITDYAADALMSALTNASTVANVQAAIDEVNNTKVTAAIAAVTGLDTTKLATARTLVASYVPNTTDAEKTAYNAEVKALNIDDAVIQVNAAQTKASIKTALTNLAALDSTLTEKINDTLLSDYIAEIKTARDIAATGVDQTSEINTIMGTVLSDDTTAAITGTKGLKNLAVDANDATVKAAFQYLADVTATATPKFDMTTINDTLLSKYRDAVIAGSEASVTDVTGIITTVNSPVGALNAIDTTTPTADAATLLTLLKVPTLKLNIVDANSADYFAELVGIDTAITGAAGANGALVTDLPVVSNLIDAINAKVSLNAATTATDAKTALTSFAIATNNTDYLDLSSTAKLEVAGLVLTDRPTAGFAVSADVTTSVGATAAAGKMNAYTTLISDVNAATTNTDMTAKLGNLGYAPFNSLTAARQNQVAENFIAAFPMTTAVSPARIPYTSLAAIEAAIDAAIAK